MVIISTQVTKIRDILLVFAKKAGCIMEGDDSMNFMKLYTKAGAIDWKWLVKTYGVPIAFGIIQTIQGVKTAQEHQEMWKFFEAYKNQSKKS